MEGRQWKWLDGRSWLVRSLCDRQIDIRKRVVRLRLIAREHDGRTANEAGPDSGSVDGRWLRGGRRFVCCVEGEGEGGRKGRSVVVQRRGAAGKSR